MVWPRLMCSSPSLYLGFVIFLVSITWQRMATSQSDFEYYNCQNEQGNYTANSTYKANLDHLLSTFTSHRQIDYGFYNLSYGQDREANAIGLCRGDVGPSDCQTCLNNTITLLIENCPTQIETIGWYDECMFRYSDRSIFGVMEPSPAVFSWRTRNASDPERFTQAARNLLESLTSEAAAGDSRLKFAAGDAEIPNYWPIYGAVQCTPDLSANDCTNCLLGAIAQIRDCCDGKMGGRVGRPSCNIRFDIDPFIQNRPESAPPPLNLPNTTTTTTTPQGNSSGIVVFIVVPLIVVIIAAVALIIISIFLKRRKLKSYSAQNLPEDEVINAESLQFDFDTIRVATDGFSDENQLGKGGFGVVYKGRLPDGRSIAVKRLFQGSKQGDEEFKNEILLVAKLQHRNLVQLLGFCFKHHERLLIYEFVENSSLEKFLFNPIKRERLDWKTRYSIIDGIVRGLVYLHEDSQLTIIHRDLKACNILLDAEMNAKISDFGTAKLFDYDQTQGNTKRIMGTFGYMAPEYAWNGCFSVKTDVFSFGVLILEIVSGQKNNRAQTNKEIEESLVSLAWRSWGNGNALDIVDPCLRNGSRMEMGRCIHIGLLCVQANLGARPTMSTVLLMLNNGSFSLPTPSQPAFFVNSAASRMRGQSQGHNETQGLNYMSISELYPR
ncbi:putative receptor-like protein kinase At4g00960 [Cucurbita moschata]|uniref:Receptor-like protein kinase At4g00960 n=1 Tax=Cucurbita moschata TaxID=3662 RepID=A0A6J1EI89_CUCMO|nr:putative receptor-like protein kinase At4g00960 [Cucurbita moschata]